MWLALVLAAAPLDAPTSIVLLPESGAALPIAAAPTTGAPSSLVDARKMAEQLRYEEAVVEYQRYLATPDRPLGERAQAMLELGFVYLVLGDQPNAESRALEALELDAKLSTPPNAPAKQVDFLNRMRKAFQARAKLELQPAGDSPWVIKVKLVDPERKVTRVLLRHALTSTGPFYSTEMTCEDDLCTGAIPPPKDVSSFTAWYFVEGLDALQATQARAANPEAPLQLSVVDQKPWYTSPFVWGGLGAAIIAGATVAFLLSPQPPK